MRPTEKNRETFIELLSDFDHGMLVTRSPTGGLHSRPMALARSDGDGTVYFSTSIDSGKVDEIRHDPEVNVAFQDGGKYLSLTGRARVVDDRRLVDELWQPGWKIWFPEGKEDPELRILVVDARRGEYWDVGGAQRLAFAWQAAKALIQGEEMEQETAGSHAEVRL